MKTFETSRDIPAPAEQIFAAFSDPERLARWWGPEGFTNTFEQNLDRLTTEVLG